MIWKFSVQNCLSQETPDVLVQLEIIVFITDFVLAGTLKGRFAASIVCAFRFGCIYVLANIFISYFLSFKLSAHAFLVSYSNEQRSRFLFKNNQTKQQVNLYSHISSFLKLSAKCTKFLLKLNLKLVYEQVKNLNNTRIWKTQLVFFVSKFTKMTKMCRYFCVLWRSVEGHCYPLHKNLKQSL